jgi:hypothetical protein
MSPRPHLLLLAVASTLMLTGCLTGDRPTLAEESAVGAPVGDPSVDAVLLWLGNVDGAVFTAEYQITNNFGPVTKAATVTQTADRARSITVGDIRFVIDGAAVATCNLGSDAGTCSSSIDDAAISDLQVTHQFYGRSAANRLRTDAARRVGPTEGYEAEFAGRPAACVSVPVSGGSKVYCALEEGVLASYQGPDVLIELTSFDTTPDDTLFVLGG